MIPILDLKAQYKSIKDEIDSAISGVLTDGVFIMGPKVKAFEAQIGSYLGIDNAIALNSGTDALHLALRALGIGPGDEVITTPFTFVATTEAIGIVGATPVFVDIDPTTLNLDPEKLENAITPRTKAIMPVHLYGLPAPMGRIMEIARKYHVSVVEDCAQAIGAHIEGRNVGTFGDVSCFSFFPSKNLGAYGDGGLVATNDSSLAEQLRALRVHGGAIKYHHSELGINSRLDELQAAILSVKLRHLERWTEARRSIASMYDQALGELAGVALLPVPQGTWHVYHQYTVRLTERDEIKRRLADSGIQTMIYYPVPLHLQQVHASLGHTNGDFPHSEAAAREVLSLPMYPELEPESQQTVIRQMERCCKLSSAIA